MPDNHEVMTKSTTTPPSLNLDEMLPEGLDQYPRLVSRHYWQDDSSRHLTLLYRRIGQSFVSTRDFYVFPHPLRSLAREWDTDSPLGFYGLKLILAGSMRCRLTSGSEVELSAGSLIRYTDCDKAEVALRQTPDFVETSVCMDVETGRLLEQLGIWNRRNEFMIIPLSLQLARQYSIIYARIENQQWSHRHILQLVINLLIDAEEHNENHRQESGEDHFETKACRLLTRNFEPSYLIRDAAREMGCSETHFRRQFTRKVGMSPSEYQLRQRLSHAAGLLRTHTVQETAYKVGYTDPFVFSRQFKKLFGVPPRDFRW